MLKFNSLTEQIQFIKKFGLENTHIDKYCFKKYNKFYIDGSCIYDPMLKENLTFFQTIDFIKITNNDIDDLSKKFNLLEHQKEFLYVIKDFLNNVYFEHTQYILADDTGLGKTIQSLQLSTLFHDKIDSTLTIVFTNLSVKSQIYQELNKFKITEKHKNIVPIVINNKRELYYLLQDYEHNLIKPNFIITHYEIIRTLDSDILNDFCNFLKDKFNFVLFLMDEATKLKNRNILYKKMFKVVTSTKKSFSLLISATPIENNIVEVQNLLFLGFGGQIMNPTWVESQFVIYSSFINPKSTQKFNRVKVIKEYKNLELFKSILSSLMIRRVKTDLNQIQLPELNEYYVKISDIDKYQVRMIKLLNEDISKLDYNNVVKSLISYIFIRQIINSPKMFLYKEQNNEIKSEVYYNLEKFTNYINQLNLQTYFSPKELALNNLLIEIFRISKNKRVVIFTFYETMQKILYETLSKIYKNVYLISGKTPVTLRDKIIRETYKKESCILVTTDSLSYGKNLQHFDYLINFDLPYNPSRLWQRIGRIHRIGSDNKKYVYNLFTPIEKKVINILKKKMVLFNFMMNDNEKQQFHKRVMTEISHLYYLMLKRISEIS